MYTEFEFVYLIFAQWSTKISEWARFQYRWIRLYHMYWQFWGSWWISCFCYLRKWYLKDHMKYNVYI